MTAKHFRWVLMTGLAAAALSGCGDKSPIVDPDTTRADNVKPGDPETAGRDTPVEEEMLSAPADSDDQSLRETRAGE